MVFAFKSLFILSYIRANIGLHKHIQVNYELWEKKYNSINTRLDELTKLLEEKDKQNVEIKKEIAEKEKLVERKDGAIRDYIYLLADRDLKITRKDKKLAYVKKHFSEV